MPEMLRRLSHRGPDGEGAFRRERVILGHRRLKIIDPEGGKQPMTNEKGDVWLTYNGELYNYRELRGHLLAKGHVFRTQSDTEVIVHAFEEWGADCVKRFRGMFALGLVDFRHRTVFLARDHFGIKPLYYRAHAGGLAFASELNSLCAAPGPPLQGDARAVEFFLRYQYIPAPYTIYSGIQKLPPAHALVGSLDGGELALRRYWSLEEEVLRATADKGLASVSAVEVIRESVHAHLVADVPFGVLLSGGVDSTLVACLMCEDLGHPVQAFSIGFHEKAFSELHFAEQVARKLKLDWHAEVVASDSFAGLESLLRRYGEPFGDSSALPTWQVAQLTRGRVPMVLAGDGGDEAFAGYQSYAAWVERNAPGRFWRSLRSCNLRGAARSAIEALSGETNQTADRRLDLWQKIVSYSRVLERSRLWQREYQPLTGMECEPFVEAADRHQSSDLLSFAQGLDYSTYLPNDILTKVDIATMAHGLEARVPLIDLHTVRFALSRTYEERVDPTAKSAPWGGKVLLKKLVAERFGESFAWRRKQGFAIPLKEWMRDKGPGQAKLTSLLADDKAKIFELLRPEPLRRIQCEVARGKGNHRLLWLVLVLALWMEDHPSVAFKP